MDKNFFRFYFFWPLDPRKMTQEYWTTKIDPRKLSHENWPAKKWCTTNDPWILGSTKIETHEIAGDPRYLKNSKIMCSHMQTRFDDFVVSKIKPLCLQWISLISYWVQIYSAWTFQVLLVMNILNLDILPYYNYQHSQGDKSRCFWWYQTFWSMTFHNNIL